MSIHRLDETRTYAQIREDARARIDADQAAGGDRAAQVQVHERLWGEHVAATGEKGDPCQSCGNAWPCWALGGILAPE